MLLSTRTNISPNIHRRPWHFLGLLRVLSSHLRRHEGRPDHLVRVRVERQRQGGVHRRQQSRLVLSLRSGYICWGFNLIFLFILTITFINDIIIFRCSTLKWYILVFFSHKCMTSHVLCIFMLIYKQKVFHMHQVFELRIIQYHLQNKH